MEREMFKSLIGARSIYANNHSNNGRIIGAIKFWKVPNTVFT